MTAEFFGAVVGRIFAIGCGLVSNLAALRLYSLYLEPSLYGRVMVATQILSYLPLLDGGFRTVTSRHLLGIAEPEHRSDLIRFSQVFYTFGNSSIRHQDDGSLQVGILVPNNFVELGRL